MIHVAFTADSNYLMNLAVALHSLSKNAEEEVTIHLFVTTLKSEVVDRLRACIPSSNVSLRIYPLDLSKVNNIAGLLPKHVNQVAYYRIFLAEILTEVDKLIYLDSDVLILNSLDELWNEDISSTGIGAVRDDSVFYLGDPEGVAYCQELGVDEHVPYFNNGILLLDLEHWRELKISSKIIRFIVDDNMRTGCSDQAGMNAIFAGSWTALPLCWNVQSNYFYTHNWPEHISSEKIKQAIDKPNIIHFTGPHKPTKIINRHPYSLVWKQSLMQTPFAVTGSKIDIMASRFVKQTYNCLRSLNLMDVPKQQLDFFDS
jgi:lipopolysaccharide biosynthesis glycosyltransferase